MAQALFDALSAEDDDIFQCGRCGKQFTSLPAFVSHKQSRCAPPPILAQNQLRSIPMTNTNNNVAAAVGTQTPLLTQNISYTNATQPIKREPINNDYTTSQQTTCTQYDLQNSPVKQSPFLSQVVSTVPNVTSTGANSLAFTNSQVVKQEIQSQDVQSIVPQQQHHQQEQLTSTALTPRTNGKMYKKQTVNAVTLDADRLNNKATNQKAAHKVAKPKKIITILPSVEQQDLILQQKLKSHHTEDILLKDDCDIVQSCISGKKKLHCEVCDKHFAKNVDLQQHVRSHTKEKPFQCIVCGRAFALKSNVKKHMSTHKNSPVKQSLSQVVSTVPNVTSTGANSLAFTNSQVVKQEIQSQDVQSTVNAVTLDADQLNNKATTQKAAHKVAKPKKIITILPSVEQQDLILQQKLKSHHTEDILLKDDCDIVQSCISGKKKLHCEVCDKHFAKNVDLQQHVRSHTKEKPFQCIVCGRAFALKSNVKKHMSTHKNSPVKQSPFLSQVVSTVPNVTSTGANSLAFTNSQVVKQEIQSQDVQSTVNAVTLDADQLNNKATTQKAAHKVAKPKKIITILPSVEQQDLILQQKLKSHHTEDILLKDDCDIVQSCISGKKKLHCEVCDKHFAKNVDLQQHVRSHTKEKPFQCIVCGRAFALKSNVKKHMSTHKNSPVKQSLSQVVSTVPNVTSTGANSLAFTNSQVVKQEIQSQDVQSTVNAVTLDADQLNNKATTQKAAHKVAKPKKIITILPSVEQQDLILQQKLKSHHTEDILLKDDCDIVQSCISGKKKLHCEVCDKHFAKNVDLQQHVRSHTKEKPFQCIVCGRAFALKSNVKKHMSTHKNSPVKQSPFLSQVVSTVPNVTSTGANSLAFTNSQVVKQEIQSQDVQSTLNAVTLDADRLNNKATTQKAAHTVTQPGNIVIILPSVEQEALILQQKKHLMLQQKLKSPHTEDFLLKDDCDIGQSCISDKKNLRCEVCDKHFTKNFNLQQHVRSHTGEKPFQCIVCGRAFAQKYNIKKHMSTHKVWPSGMGIILPRQPSGSDDEGGDDDDDEDSSLPIPDQPPPPPQPPPPSTILDAPNDKEQRLNVVVSFLCQYCPEKFKSHYQLKSHMVRHKSEQVYKCVVKSCGQTFKELEAFLSHTKSHKEDMTYQCQVCSKHFTTLYELDVHENTHSRNGPSRNFQCTKCLYRYSTPEGLEHHLLISSHDFSCPHCKKIFPCGRNLRRHLPIHGRIGCKKKLNRPDKLKACIITHSGVKPFKCKECGKCFTGRSHLIEHERGHKGDYKFKCQKCGRGFFRPNRCHNHKCKRRKLGHPPKHMITVISDTNKPTGENEQTPCKRGRPLGRTAAKAQILPQI